MTAKLFEEKQLLEGFSQKEKIEIRSLEWPDDYDKGICDVLGQLTVCRTPRDVFGKVFDEMKKGGSTFVVVAHRRSDDAIVGCGTVFIEPKFVHNGRSCAHIEDIVVSAKERGNHVGQAIIESLIHISRQSGSYKVILNCSENNVGFYKKCGFEPREVEMVVYF